MEPYLHVVYKENENIHRYIDVIAINKESTYSSTMYVLKKSYEIQFAIPDLVYFTHISIIYKYTVISPRYSKIEAISYAGAKAVDIENNINEAVNYFYSNFNMNEEIVKSICEKAIDLVESKNTTDTIYDEINGNTFAIHNFIK